MVSASGNDTGLEDPKPHFFSERTHLDHESASQARANPLVETFKIIRRPIGSDHHLATRVDQRIQEVRKLRLSRLALQKLQVVDDQHVDNREALP